MDFVWIYVEKYSYYAKSGLWNEIEYSIKSVRKNYPGAVCWVVGDDPGGVKHIPCDPVLNHPSGPAATIDAHKKFRAIIDSDVGDEFVLMYDDIYIMQPLTYKDLKIVYGYSKVNDVENYFRKWSRSYKMIWRDTYRKIKELREDVYDWEAHLPRLFDKYQLGQVMDAYSCDDSQLIATSLYMAHYAKETLLMDSAIQFDLVNTIGVNYDQGFTAKFMNIMDSAITLEFKNKMREYFD